MKKAFGLSLIGLLAAGCATIGNVFDGPQVQGSGKVKSESRKVSGFTKIASIGSADCEVRVGPAVSVKVTADDNILPLIKTEVKNGKLEISSKGSFSTKSGIKVAVTVPNLEGFEIVGSGDASIQGVKGKAFACGISGSGDIKANGNADKLDATISGSGDMDLSHLRARDASASISGSGDIQVNVTGSLSGVVSGSGSIRYSGNPKNVSRVVSGSGEIEGK